MQRLLSLPDSARYLGVSVDAMRRCTFRTKQSSRCCCHRAVGRIQCARYFVTKRFIACPECNKAEHWIDHILDGQHFSFGPWYCHNCGYGFVGSVVNGEVHLEYHGHIRKVIDTVRLVPQSSPIILKVNGIIFEGRDASPEECLESNKRFFYEEHQCPTNILHDTEDVIIDGDDDVHGLFEYVGTEIIKPVGHDSVT